MTQQTVHSDYLASTLARAQTDAARSRSPRTDAVVASLNLDDDLNPYFVLSANLAELARELEQDAMTMALRLYGESPETFSPETREVMARWRPHIRKLIADVSSVSAEKGGKGS